MQSVRKNFETEQQLRNYLAARYSNVASGDRELLVNVAIDWYCNDCFKGSDCDDWMYKSMISNPPQKNFA